ncbi:MAG: hypothetical protein ACKVUS_03085 [Saprospiraceae bacterium]
MNQLFTHLAFLSGLATLFLFCKTERNCRELLGRWTNREGQTLSFEPEGKALWLVKFGSQFDTFPISYRYDCTQKTATLDLMGFQSGPLVGKTLFGIIEWSSDSVFRFGAEPGVSVEARPTDFSAERTERYFRD